MSYPAGQASTEAQGPWDSNWQIEDDFSWFIPGKRGDHEMKFGARYNYTELAARFADQRERHLHVQHAISRSMPANPRTYPERLTIRMGEFKEWHQDPHVRESYAQDKWKIGDHTTLSIGVRYDLEIIPIDVDQQSVVQRRPAVTGRCQQHLARASASRTRSTTEGKSVVRGGYGMFYNRTILGAIDDTLEFGEAHEFLECGATSRTTARTLDRRRAVSRPHPLLVNGPYVNRAGVRSDVPARGTRSGTPAW